MLRTQIPLLEDLLRSHAAELGADYARYRNHAYRVANLCAALAAPSEVDERKIAIAAALHDIGIWTDDTFDYLEPSIAVASAYLATSGQAAWTDEIRATILDHHKILPRRSTRYPLVEPFRRADWVDVSRGVLTFGLSRALLREIFTVWPDLGFRFRLVQLTWQRTRSHPLSPLPVLRL